MNQSAFHRIIMFGLFLTLACASVSAQATVHIFSGKIPFDFNVWEQKLPAGEYTIRYLSDTPSMLLIQSTDRQVQAVISTNRMGTRQAPGKTRLVFSKYGDQHFLAQVWARGDNNGRMLVKSHVERDLAKSASAKSNTIAQTDYRRQK